MDDSYSLARGLPDNIIECIVGCLAREGASANQHTFGDYNYDHDAAVVPLFIDTPSLFPILSLSRQWRRAALAHLYKEVVFRATRDGSRTADGWSLRARSLENAIRFKHHNLVKVAHLQMPLNGVLCGNVPMLLNRGPYKAIVLPSVTQLTVRFTYSTHSRRRYAQMAPSWVERLTAHTRRLFPNADRRLFYAASNDNRNDPEWIYRIAGAMSSDDTAHALAFHLAFPRSTSVSLEAMTSLVHTATGLRHVRLAFRTISDIHVDLVRRNSLTLESIHLSEIDSRHCLRLLIQQDAQGSNKPMVYPNVRTLEVGTDCLYYLNQRTLPLGVPFPSLVSLNCMHAYPFANDVLLRGNSTTLESISLCVDERTLGMFAKTDLFSDSNDNAYPVLRRVRIYSTDYSRYVLPADRMPDVLRMTLCVPEGVQCLELDALRGAAPDSVISAIHNAPISRRNLRVLGIPHIKFSLAGLVELVQMLPNIEHLAIALSVEEGLHSELHPASNDCRLSTLRLYFSANETDRQLFEQATRRLALLIPSLRRIITDRGDGGIAILKPADLALNPADPVDMIQ